MMSSQYCEDPLLSVFRFLLSLILCLYTEKRLSLSLSALQAAFHLHPFAPAIF